MEKELTILMPCLNEENTIQKSIIMAKQFINKNNINAEILIVDNGSADNSVNIALSEGAIVVKEDKKGYGNALRKGFNTANGKYIIMGDCDTTYDFSNLDDFLFHFKNGEKFVIGNRYKGNIEKGAMPFLHRYIGVPILSFIGRIRYKVNVGDFHCGLRGFENRFINSLNFTTSGMEFATEIIKEVSKTNINIIEIPIVLRRCEYTKRKPHLKTVRDGYRHLKFLLKNN